MGCPHSWLRLSGETQNQPVPFLAVIPKRAPPQVTVDCPVGEVATFQRRGPVGCRRPLGYLFIDPAGIQLGELTEEAKTKETCARVLSLRGSSRGAEE